MQINILKTIKLIGLEIYWAIEDQVIKHNKEYAVRKYGLFYLSNFGIRSVRDRKRSELISLTRKYKDRPYDNFSDNFGAIIKLGQSLDNQRRGNEKDYLQPFNPDGTVNESFYKIYGENIYRSKGMSHEDVLRSINKE